MKLHKFKNLYLSNMNKFFQTPPKLVNFLKKAILDGHNQYSRVVGDFKLIEEISNFYSHLYNRKLTVDEINVNSEITFFYDAILFNYLEKNDEEILCLGPVSKKLKEKFNFHKKKISESKIEIENNKIIFDFEDLRNKIKEKTKFILINDPCFNSGRIYTEDEKNEIFQISKEFPDLYFIFDKRADFLNLHKNSFEQNKEIFDKSIFFYSGGKMFNCEDWGIGFTIGSKQLSFLMGVYYNSLRFNVSTPAVIALKNYFKLLNQEKKTFKSEFFLQQKKNFEKYAFENELKNLNNYGLKKISTDFSFYNIYQVKKFANDTTFLEIFNKINKDSNFEILDQKKNLIIQRNFY